MLLEPDECQLVLVDYQMRLMPALFEGPQVLANAVILGKIAQLMGVRCIGTEQLPGKLGQSMPELRGLFGQVLEKTHFNACADGLIDILQPPAPARKPQGANARSLPKHLQRAPEPESPAQRTIVIAGCEAHVCLLQTALDLLEEEFEVWVVTDACTSRTERNRDAAFDRLAGAGAELVTTEMVAFEWLGDADHPAFKQVLALVK
ncbi:MAG: hypothetical protein JWP47_646 [Polaromonas sp.]|jgi:nicotinamidase-related amidase|nr:hypothetical protein [Polaromonas sp.]